MSPTPPPVFELRNVHKRFTKKQDLIGRVLELAGKLGTPQGAAPAPAPAALDEEVVAALVALGWSSRDATAAVDAVSAPGQDRAATLRAALQRLGGARG